MVLHIFLTFTLRDLTNAQFHSAIEHKPYLLCTIEVTSVVRYFSSLPFACM